MIRLAIKLVVVTLYVYFLTDIGIKLLEPEYMPVFSPSVTAAQSQTAQKDNVTKETLQIILDRNIFGVSSQSSIPEKTPPAIPEEKDPSLDDYVQTTAPLLLRATIILEHGASYAIIQQKGGRRGEELIYKEGDSIQDTGIIVERIMRNRVLLNNKGNKEYLEIAELVAYSPHISTTSKDSEGRYSVRQLDETHYIIDRQTINYAISNVNHFINEFRMAPHFTDGEPDGFVVARMRRGSLVEKMGLQRGDIIKGINGRSITRPEDAFTIYQQLRGESNIYIDLVRDNQNLTMYYEIK